MKKQKKQHAGIIYLVSGGLLALVGAVRLIMFLNSIEAYKTVSAAQLFRLLVVPHIVLLAGFGLVATAFVLFTRRAIIRKRQRQG